MAKKNITLTESQFKYIIKEILTIKDNTDINKIDPNKSKIDSIMQDKNHPNYNTIKRVIYPFGSKFMPVVTEVAFKMLGYSRFAINGEISFNKMMDNPWDDAYSIIEWGVNHNGLDSKYLGRVSSQYSKMSDDEFKQYTEQVNSGKRYWFTRGELNDIFSKLPTNLRKQLVQDMINVSRIDDVNREIYRLTAMNDGENMSEFQEIILQLMQGKKWNRENLQEPINIALSKTFELEK